MTGMFFRSLLEDEVPERLPKWYKQPNLYVRAG